MNSRKKGKIYENFAENWLIDNFFFVTEKNYRYSGGEIDLVAIKDNTLYFIEVKYISSLKFFELDKKVPYFKKRHIYKTSLYFLQQKSIPHDKYSIRFSLIAINKQQSIEFIENFFTAEEVAR